MQIYRRILQTAVLLLIILIPLFNYYGIKVHQKDETTIGKSVPLSALHLVFKGRDRDKVIAWSHKVKGSVWTIDIFGFKLSDPLAVFESSVVTMYLYWPFILSMAIPLLVTLILGRVYCGWLCPFHFVLEINAKVRRLLEKTGYPTRDIAFSRRTRYIVLAVGLVAAFFFGMPLLSLIYPPAVMSREFFYRIFNSAWGNGFFILLGICFVELILSRRWWCRSVCPGGAVYTALSHRRLLNIERNEHTCDRCGDCNPVCPYALDPMNKQLSRSSQCDNCGLCISSCRPKALKYKFSIKRPAVRHSRGTGKTKSGDRK